MWFRLYVQKLNMSSLISNKNPNFPLEPVQVCSAPQAQPVKSDSQAQSRAAANSVSSGSAGIRPTSWRRPSCTSAWVSSVRVHTPQTCTSVQRSSVSTLGPNICPSPHDNVFANIYARHFNAGFISQFE